MPRYTAQAGFYRHYFIGHVTVEAPNVEAACEAVLQQVEDREDWDDSGHCSANYIDAIVEHDPDTPADADLDPHDGDTAVPVRLGELSVLNRAVADLPAIAAEIRQQQRRIAGDDIWTDLTPEMLGRWAEAIERAADIEADADVKMSTTS